MIADTLPRPNPEESTTKFHSREPFTDYRELLALPHGTIIVDEENKEYIRDGAGWLKEGTNIRTSAQGIVRHRKSWLKYLPSA